MEPRETLEELRKIRLGIPGFQQQLRKLEHELEVLEARIIEKHIQALGDIKQLGSNEEQRKRSILILLDDNEDYTWNWKNVEGARQALADALANRDNWIDELTVWKYEVKERTSNDV